MRLRVCDIDGFCWGCIGCTSPAQKQAPTALRFRPLDPRVDPQEHGPATPDGPTGEGGGVRRRARPPPPPPPTAAATAHCRRGWGGALRDAQLILLGFLVARPNRKKGTRSCWSGAQGGAVNVAEQYRTFDGVQRCVQRRASGMRRWLQRNAGDSSGVRWSAFSIRYSGTFTASRRAGTAACTSCPFARNPDLGFDRRTVLVGSSEQLGASL
eukprot:gene11877-biopygen6405